MFNQWSGAPAIAMTLGNNNHFVYILQCSDHSLYTGYTSDIGQRLKDHNQGQGSKYVRSRLPAQLVYYETHHSKGAALSREAAIKKLSRRQKITLITDGAL